MDYKLALEVVKASGFEWVYFLDEHEVDEKYQNGNHFFTFGESVYSRWQCESEDAWVAELQPTFGEGGEVVAYKVIEIEKVL